MLLKKADILKVLYRLSPLFIEKSVVPMLECLNIDNSRINVCTGSIWAFSTDAPFKDLQGSLRSTLFFRMIENMPNEDIELTKEGDELTVVSGEAKADFKITQQPYFDVNVSSEKWTHKIPLENIAEGLSKVLVSTSELRPEFNGVLIQSQKDKFYLYSTDNMSVSRCKVNNPENIEIQRFLPKFFCTIILYLLNEYKTGTLFFSEKYIKCEFATTTVITSFEETKSMDYEAIFKTWEHSHITTIPVVDLQSVIFRNFILNSLMLELDKVFLIAFKESLIHITSKSGWGIVDEKINCQTGHKVECKVNSMLLKRFVETVDDWKFIVKDDLGLWAGFKMGEGYEFEHYFLSNLV